MSYEAKTLSDALASGWTLTGVLAKLGSEDVKITHDPIQFIAHQPPEGSAPINYVMVRNTPLEDVVEHPQFDEVIQNFTITCVLGLTTGYAQDDWDNAEANVELMEAEVLRIIRTIYDPDSGKGTFFRTNRTWANEDDFTGQTKVIRRTLEIQLIKLRSRLTTVFTGFMGVMLFDHTNSQGVSPPASDYQYTEVYEVEGPDEGWESIEEFGVINPDGKGVPVQTRGQYRGFLSFDTFVKKADIGSTSTYLLNNIYKPLGSNGNLAKVVLLLKNPDTEPSPAYLTQVITCYITRVKTTNKEEDILRRHYTAKLAKPSTESIA